MVTSFGSTDLLPDLARRHATAIPDGAAIVDGPNVWTWRMLDERASAIATAVADAGGRPGERVGLAVGTSALGIAALHGAPRCGVTAVLVHPRLSGPEVATLLDATACRVLVVDPA
ncbi:MAG: AMP-binding protein, partial [Candidatus Limnocylindrales bacterium]